MSGKRVKQSLYFPAQMLAELQAEAARHDRGVARILQWAWQLARDEVRRLPAANFPGTELEAAQ